MKRVTKEAKLHDSIISKSYVSLIKHYKRYEQDSCLAYFRRLKEYADKNESNLANYYFYNYNAGYYGLFLEEGEDSFQFISSNLKKALEYAKECEDSKILANGYSRLSQEYFRYGKNEEALDYSKKGIAYANERGLWLEVAYGYGTMGEIYLEGYKMTETSLQYLLKSDSIYKQHQYQGDKSGFIMSTIGDIYKELDDIAEAESYQTKALALFKANDNEYQQKYIIGKLASIEQKKKNYPQAIAYLEDCIRYYRDNKYHVKEAMFHIGLSDVYFENNQIEKAIETAQTAITLSSNLNNDFGVLLGLIYKSRFLLADNNYQESYKLAKEAKEIADAMDSYIDKKDALDLLSKTAEKLGRFEEAYNFSKEHKSVSDTLVKRQNLQQTKTLEAQYKNAQQEQEIQVLQSQNELVEEQKRNQRNLLFSIIGFVFLAGLVLFFLFRNRQKTNQKLKELDTIKSNFFANISHEFRTPLTLISGPIEKQLENTKLDNSDRKDLEMVQRNSQRLLDLVDQLLDLSKLESGNLKLQVKEGNVSLLLKSLTAAFQYKAEKGKLNYVVDIQETESSWFDADAIEKIVVNLLSNAFKYVPKQGMIRFSSAVRNGSLEMQIENDGAIGGAKNMDTVFNRFYQEDDHADGVGIGLALVKELVALYRGTVTVANTANKTVLFTIKVPVVESEFSKDEKTYSAVEISSIKDSQTVEKIQLEEERISEINEDTPILLVVEDNEDIRTFVKTAFESEYHVLEAENGAEGIELAIAMIPDIIISDIMMPNVDGMELCQTLKTDERTSHIPIILLTAKIEEQAQHEGLELGADDYVLKPFKTKFLESRVKNLVLTRKQLRTRYSKEVVLKPKDIAISRIDEKFIGKVQAILDEHLTDPGFNTQDFSKLLVMNRMQLHRKLKALTGLTASEFVRSQRLHLAASLLKKSDVNVSEVCYQVGFNNHSYFTKCFKDAFGCLPSDYS